MMWMVIFCCLLLVDDWFCSFAGLCYDVVGKCTVKQNRTMLGDRPLLRFRDDHD